MNNKVLVVGPSSSGMSGGQVTHMENIKSLFNNKEVCYFYSSSGMEGSELFFIKAIRLIRTWIVFPFSLIGRKVIHINSSFDVKALVRDLYLFLAACIFGKKLIIQYHGGSPDKFSLVNNKIIKKLLQKIFSRSTVLVLTSEQFSWVDRMGAYRLVRMKNYVDLPQINKIKNERFIFLYMGRIIKEKGIFDILNAVKIVRNLDFEVRICGSGENKSDFLDAIKENKLEDKVKFIGNVSGSAKQKELQDCDVFLYPSYYPEGLPYSVLEALSYNCAVVYTDSGALKELLENDVTGIKVEMQNPDSLATAMKLVIGEPAYRLRIASNGRKLIESEMSLPILKRELEQIWHEN